MGLLLYILMMSCFTLHINAYIPNMLHGRLKNGFTPPPKLKDNNVPLPEDRWFTQKLNHFNLADSRTWQQRYFVNDSFHTPGGPVFLMIGGEGTASPVWMVEGQWIKYAAKYKALCLQLEHRFYGKSHPTKDISVDSLQFLSSEQALADLAAFRTFIGETHNVSDSKWIAFGGSYPGSLAAWFRLKSPHLVYGSVSSSAPLRAVIDFSDYLGVVRDALDTTGPQCTANIQNATVEIGQLLKTGDGRQKLKQMFKLCDDIDISNQNDIANLFSTLAGNFEGIVQYNKDNREFEGAVGTNITVDTLCDIMTAPHTTPLQNYAIVNALLMKTYSSKCVDFTYKSLIQGLSDTDWKSEAGEGGRQWTYQTCTEFGYYQSSDLQNQPFGHSFPVQFSVQQCADIFGPQFNQTLLEKAVEWTNTNYGALALKVTRVIFVNGSIDPWHALGFTLDVGGENHVIYIKGTAHCANMYPDSPTDPPQLKQAREQISAILAQWLEA